jgi:hypothetical protein
MNRVNGILFWIIVYTLFIIFFHKYLSEKLGDNNFLNKLIYKPSERITCSIEYDACGNDIIDGQCVLFGVISLIIGYHFPNRIILFLITILTAEFTKQLFEVEPRFIINPLVALTGYMIGSYLSAKNNNSYRIKKYEFDNPSFNDYEDDENI